MEPIKELSKSKQVFKQDPILSLKLAISSNQNCRILRGKSLRATLSSKSTGNRSKDSEFSDVVEVISNSVTFQKRFKVPFDFLNFQDYQISLEEVEDPKNPVFLFTTSFRLGVLLNDPSCEFKCPITIGEAKNPTKSKLYLKAIRESDNDVQFKVRFNGVRLTNFGTFSSIKPQLKILRPKNLRARQTSTSIHSWQEVYASNFQNSGSCQFEEMVIPLSNLCGGNLETPIKIDIYNRKAKNKHKLKGEAITTAHKLLTKGSHFKVINKKRKKEAGGVIVQKVVKERLYDTLDFLLSGLDIVQSYAIDFTKSNKDVKQSNSLHYISPMKLNYYQRCFKNFQSVLSQYSQDLKIGGFGFGAKVNYPGFSSDVSHYFPLSGDKKTEYVDSPEKFEENYLKALDNVKLFGPTLFEPQLIEIIESVKNDVKKDLMSYRIHIILIDGVIFDMQDTIDLLVKAASLPFSLIVIGIGDSDFEEMEDLNQPKDKFVSSNGQNGCRINARFFKFNDFIDMDDDLMVKEVLEKIPSQICEYYSLSKTKPDTGMAIEDSTIFGLLDDEKNNESEEEEKDLKVALIIPEEQAKELQDSEEMDSSDSEEAPNQTIKMVKEVEGEGGETIRVIQIVEGQEPHDLPSNAMVFKIEAKEGENEEDLLQQKLKEMNLEGGEENSKIQIIKQGDLSGDNFESNIWNQIEGGEMNVDQFSANGEQ